VELVEERLAKHGAQAARVRQLRGGGAAGVVAAIERRLPSAGHLTTLFVGPDPGHHPRCPWTCCLARTASSCCAATGRTWRPTIPASTPSPGELGDLPLALHLAGSYLLAYRAEVNLDDYLAELGPAGGDPTRSLLGEGLDSPSPHPPRAEPGSDLRALPGPTGSGA